MSNPQPWPVTGSIAFMCSSTLGSPPLVSMGARPDRRRSLKPVAAPRSRRSRPSRPPRLPPAQPEELRLLLPNRAATTPPVALCAVARSHPAVRTMGTDHPPAGSARPVRRRWLPSRCGRRGRPDTRPSSSQSVRPGTPPRTPWRVSRAEEDVGGGERAALRSRPKAPRPHEPPPW